MKKIFVYIALFSLLYSCNREEITTNSNQLHGDWFMQSYTVFGPSNSNLSENYILWSFNTSNNTIKIVNYTFPIYGIPSGEYNFSYTENEIFIEINTSYTTRFAYSFNDDTLILQDHPELDGPYITFVSKEQNCLLDPLSELEWLSNITLQEHPNPIEIIQFVYNGECVYSVNSCINCADSQTVVYNVSGEIICAFGGLAGFNICPDFYNIATNKRYLYTESEGTCNQSVIISNTLYNNVIEQPSIDSLEINEDCLKIVFSSSGCSGDSWELQLIDANEIAESNPVQRSLKLSIVNTEVCLAVITKELTFDISQLQTVDNQILLNISNNQILYEY